MKYRVLAPINHSGKDLEIHEIYDFPDKDAAGLLEEKLIEKVDPNKQAEPLPEATPRPAEQIDAYVAEAHLTPEQRAKAEAEGKLNDPKPVETPTHEKDPAEAEPIIEGQDGAGAGEADGGGGRGGMA